MNRALRSKVVMIVFIIAAVINFIGLRPVNAESSPQLKVHFIDVGEADCILIQQGNKAMLIDAGNNSDEAVIKKYLLKQGVNKFDIVVGTHVDEDHIGSLDAVINNFEVDKIYMPKCPTVTKHSEDVKKAAEKKELKFQAPVSEESFKLGEAQCTILAPVSMGYDKLNNYSIVIKLTYKDTSFLFTGDAEAESEREMMRRGFDLSANVLKIAHHGSIRSTSNEFLERVKPQYAVIMTGKGNKYSHPHKTTLKRLKAHGVKVYRTDENGTIVVESDGKNLTFDK